MVNKIITMMIMMIMIISNDNTSNDIKDDDILVGGLEHGFYDFPYIGTIFSQLTFICFRGVGIPPTSIVLYIYIYVIIYVYM